MKLYHYSKHLLPDLKTLLQQGISEERKLEIEALSKARGAKFPYYDHISFFVDPVPLDIIHTLFPKNHPAWAYGTKLYQYEINTGDIDLKYFTMIESNVDQWLNPFYVDWLGGVHSRTKSFVKKLIGENGYTLEALEKAITPYVGKTRAAYLKGDRSLSLQYAPDVPHVMIYPHKPIQWTKVFGVTVGGNKHVPINPASSRW